MLWSAVRQNTCIFEDSGIELGVANMILSSSMWCVWCRENEVKGRTRIIYSPQRVRRISITDRVILTMRDAIPLTEVAEISVITLPQNTPVPSDA